MARWRWELAAAAAGSDVQEFGGMLAEMELPRGGSKFRDGTLKDLGLTKQLSRGSVVEPRALRLHAVPQWNRV